MRQPRFSLAHGRETLLLSLLLLTALQCGGDSFDPGALEAQGDAGRAVLDLIGAHGGMSAFRALDDLEYHVQVERYDATGALSAVSEEIHRFEAAPPRRYLLRRTGSQILEMGLHGETGWVRVDGRVRRGVAAAERARGDLWIRAVLNRAPFSLADPDVSLSMAPDGKAIIGRWAAAGDAGGSMVFFVHPETGRLQRVVFQDPRLPADAPMQVALVEDLRQEEGVWLVSQWALATTAAVMAQPDLARWRWHTKDARYRNGFTDQLYQVGSGD